MKNTSLIALLAIASAGVLSAAPASFDFKDPKSVNTIQFKLDAPIEAIAGSTNGISGSVNFDAQNIPATSGKILVAAKSLTVPNSMMSGHLQGDQWIDANGHPDISFEIAALSDVKSPAANTWTAKAAGKFTLKGVTKDLTVPVKLTLVPDALGKRIGKPELKGDLLVVRCEFSILRSDYGVNTGKMEEKVSNEIALSIAIVGSAAKP